MIVTTAFCDRCGKQQPPDVYWAEVVKTFVFDLRADGINGVPRNVDLCGSCRRAVIAAMDEALKPQPSPAPTFAAPMTNGMPEGLKEITQGAMATGRYEGSEDTIIFRSPDGNWRPVARVTTNVDTENVRALFAAAPDHALLLAAIMAGRANMLYPHEMDMHADEIEGVPTEVLVRDGDGTVAYPIVRDSFGGQIVDDALRAALVKALEGKP